MVILFGIESIIETHKSNAWEFFRGEHKLCPEMFIEEAKCNIDSELRQDKLRGDLHGRLWRIVVKKFSVSLFMDVMVQIINCR